MQLKGLIFVTFTYFLEASLCDTDLKVEANLKAYLENEYEKEASDSTYQASIAQWDFNVDVANKTKEEIATNTTLELGKRTKELWQTKFKDLKIEDYKDEAIRRQLKILHNIGSAILSDEELKNLTETQTKLANIYSTAKICPYTNQNCNLAKEGLSLTPDIETILEKSRDYDELQYVWEAWHDATGGKMRSLFAQTVELNNKAAKLNGFKDYGDAWRDSYETPTLEKDVDELWEQLAPFYGELHKYATHKLKEVYGDKLDTADGLLPAHLFGNMWAQDWNLDFLRPFPNASNVDVTAALKQQNYTALKMFEAADDFYQSMGLLPNTISYDTLQGAMIEKPSDGREVVCHASAWDFSNGRDYRIKMCTQIKGLDFSVIHHEMGHIQYFEQYKQQPFLFRSGANPGFHEAVGDTIALSVNTVKHLKKIGLVPESYESGKEATINDLMDKALSKFVFLPFGLLVDKWRWDVFSGKVEEDKWNEHWWYYREKYQKVRRPAAAKDGAFDAGAKYHVAADSQYMAYFVAHILEFQFYKSLCIAANEYDPSDKSKPLSECDFYQSKEAGTKMANGLKLGLSKHWTETLEIMTGEKKLNAEPLLEYFAPLSEFLKEYNAKL